MMVLCFFSCFRAYKYLDYVSYTFLVVFVITCSLFIVPISTVMSSLYDISKDMTWNLSPHISKIMDKKTKQILDGQLKSCCVIRCRVGNLYYMEAKAKLTTFHNIVNGIVFLMVNVKTQSCIKLVFTELFFSFFTHFTYSHIKCFHLNTSYLFTTLCFNIIYIIYYTYIIT